MLLWSRPRRRNLPARNETALSSPPHPSGLTASHLPPQGERSLWGSGPHPPQRESLQRQAAKRSFAQNSFAYFSSKKSKSVVQFAS